MRIAFVPLSEIVKLVLFDNTGLYKNIHKTHRESDLGALIIQVQFKNADRIRSLFRDS